MGLSPLPVPHQHENRYIGRVAVRSTGSFNISASTLIQGISHRFCKTIHRKDGYSYGF